MSALAAPTDAAQMSEKMMWSHLPLFPPTDPSELAISARHHSREGRQQREQHHL